MNTRLQQFLTMEGLTPARFADIMGIQRSGISHLLSGRNKPSFEFIQKMMTAFPKLNPEWLILGKGKPYKEGTSAPDMVKNDILPEYDLFHVQEEIDDLPLIEPEIQEVKEEISAPEPSENRIFEQPSNNHTQKTISRITVFYSDGTYEER